MHMSVCVMLDNVFSCTFFTFSNVSKCHTKMYTVNTHKPRLKNPKALGCISCRHTCLANLGHHANVLGMRLTYALTRMHTLPNVT